MGQILCRIALFISWIAFVWDRVLGEKRVWLRLFHVGTQWHSSFLQSRQVAAAVCRMALLDVLTLAGKNIARGRYIGSVTSIRIVIRQIVTEKMYLIRHIYLHWRIVVSVVLSNPINFLP